MSAVNGLIRHLLTRSGLFEDGIEREDLERAADRIRQFNRELGEALGGTGHAAFDKLARALTFWPVVLNEAEPCAACKKNTSILLHVAGYAEYQVCLRCYKDGLALVVEEMDIKAGRPNATDS